MKLVPTAIGTNGYGEVGVDKARGVVCYVADRGGVAISCIKDPSSK